MTRRVGSARWSVIIVLGTAVILSGIVGACWFVAREITERNRQRVQQEMREGEAASLKQSLEMLGKGGVLVSGKRLLPDGTMESPMAFSNQSAEQNQTVSIPWSVSQADYAKLAEGMGLKEVGEVLDLSALHYIPNGPQSQFTLVCNHLNRHVILVFAGSPEAKLVSISAEGID